MKEVYMNKYFIAILFLLLSTNLCFSTNNSTTLSHPQQLQNDGIMITNKTYKQIFCAYINNPKPFITTDSVLNAFHVLYQESIFQLENRQADVLESFLKDMFKAVSAPKLQESFNFPHKRFQMAVKKAKLTLAVANKIYNSKFTTKDKDLDEIIHIESGKINKSSEVSMPQWLGKPTPQFIAIDYSKFRPRGFYTQNNKLKKYFKVTKWLQTVPFMVKDNTDLLSFLILRHCFHEVCRNYTKSNEYSTFFKIYDAFLGKQDGQGINGASNWSSSYSNRDFVSLRKKLAALKAPQVNDSLRTQPGSPKGITELRILPARITPDAILFSRTTTPELNRQVPNGLEICALLGSQYAKKQLPDRIRKILAKNKDIINKDSLYGLYFHTLESLFQNNFVNAPDFMKKQSWEIKSCNTVLAGWAQLRYNWTLHTKPNVMLSSLTTDYPGFIEPNEAFWRKMATLAEKTQAILNTSKCFEFYAQRNINLYKKIAKLAENEQYENIVNNNFDIMEIVGTAFMAAKFFNPEIAKENNEKAKMKQVADGINKFIDILEKNELNLYPKLILFLQTRHIDFNDSWRKLTTACLKLQTISIKQIYNIKLLKAEKEFIKNFGHLLAQIMLYRGNSYLIPRDNSPRIIDVFCDTREIKHFRYLEVGIARAREIQVLYPTPSGKVLCTGAVMPYYEFFSKTRLDDKAWKKILDNKNKRPKIPEWLTPIVKDGALTPPNLP